MVSDPVLLDEVAADEEQFGKRVEEINFFAQLGNSRGGGISVIGDGEHAEQIRRVMLPWYAPLNQRTQLERMKEQARKLVAAWSAIPDDQPLDARTWMERYTLEVSGRGACNYDFGLLDGHGDPHPFAVAVPESTKESILRVAEPRPDFTLFAGRSRRARKKRYRRHNEELFRTAGALVRARMTTRPLGPQTDLLSRLVTTPDPETGDFLDADTVRDQILMHLSNGFNGPSITGAWLAYVLATRPDVEEKLIAEIDGITSGDPDYDLQYDDLMKLTYTTQVIKETLRIYPPQPVTIRRSLKDGMLGRYRIRKDDIILVGTLAAQRDPRFWGPDADRFDPGQFAMEKVVDRPRHAFIPFSVGKRQCMAQEVTFMMLRVVLFEMCNHYRLRPAPGATVTKNTVVTTKPAAVPVIRVPRERAGGGGAGRAARPSGGPGPAPPPPSCPLSRPPRGATGTGRPRSPDERLPDIWWSPTAATSARTRSWRALRRAGPLLRLHQRRDHAERARRVSARTQPWLLVVMTSTYTSNPPSNAITFKACWSAPSPAGRPGRTAGTSSGVSATPSGTRSSRSPGTCTRSCPSSAPRRSRSRLRRRGVAGVGGRYAAWNTRVWPVLIELAGARPREAAAARFAAENAAAGALTSTGSGLAMDGSSSAATSRRCWPPGGELSSIMRLMSPGSRRATSSRGGPPEHRGRRGTQPRVLLAPTILTNAVGMTPSRHGPSSAGNSRRLIRQRTRHIEVSMPLDISYRAGDHLGVCPKNDE